MNGTELLAALDARAYWDDDRLFVINDFGPAELEVG